MQELVSKNQEQDQAEVNVKHLAYTFDGALGNPNLNILLTGDA